jgi:hypothetical protein
MQRLSQTSERENAGTTSLGALLRAKLDNGGLRGAKRSNSLAIASICDNADRPSPQMHTTR